MIERVLLTVLFAVSTATAAVILYWATDPLRAPAAGSLGRAVSIAAGLGLIVAAALADRRARR